MTDAAAPTSANRPVVGQDVVHFEFEVPTVAAEVRGASRGNDVWDVETAYRLLLWNPDKSRRSAVGVLLLMGDRTPSPLQEETAYGGAGFFVEEVLLDNPWAALTGRVSGTGIFGNRVGGRAEFGLTLYGNVPGGLQPFIGVSPYGFVGVGDNPTEFGVFMSFGVLMGNESNNFDTPTSPSPIGRDRF